MKKQIALYAAALVAGAFALQWVEYRYFMRANSINSIVLLLVTGFAVLGVWVGTRLVSRREVREFELNTAAIASLGISPREMQVLQQLAAGSANKEIARELDISPNTVKTHVASLFSKLSASRRTEAINKARELRLIP